MDGSSKGNRCAVGFEVEVLAMREMYSSRHHDLGPPAVDSERGFSQHGCFGARVEVSTSNFFHSQ